MWERGVLKRANRCECEDYEEARVALALDAAEAIEENCPWFC